MNAIFQDVFRTCPKDVRLLIMDYCNPYFELIKEYNITNNIKFMYELTNNRLLIMSDNGYVYILSLLDYHFIDKFSITKIMEGHRLECYECVFSLENEKNKDNVFASIITVCQLNDDIIICGAQYYSDIFFVNLKNKTLEKILAFEEYPTKHVVKLIFNNNLLYVLGSWSICVWDLNNNTRTQILHMQLSNMLLLDDKLVTYGINKGVIIYNIKTSDTTIIDYKPKLYLLKFVDNNHVAASELVPNSLNIYNINTKECVHKINISGRVSCINFINEKYVVIGSKTEIMVYCLSNKEYIQKININDSLTVIVLKNNTIMVSTAKKHYIYENMLTL
jgi:hypothetical protein